MYESGIGLNATPQSSSLLDEVSVFVDITTTQLHQFESVVTAYTARPLAKQATHNANTFYNFLLFDTETNTLGKAAQLCQLSATDKSGLHLFSKYILPSQNISISASSVNKLTIKTTGGISLLFKDHQPVESVPVKEALGDFVAYLKENIARAQSRTNKQVHTILMGHNATTFDTSILLRNGGNAFTRS